MTAISILIIIRTKETRWPGDGGNVRPHANNLFFQRTVVRSWGWRGSGTSPFSFFRHRNGRFALCDVNRIRTIHARQLIHPLLLHYLSKEIGEELPFTPRLFPLHCKYHRVHKLVHQRHSQVSPLASPPAFALSINLI